VVVGEVSQLVLLAMTVAALTASACTSTTYVTPWWRIHGTYTPCLMAESGGGNGCTTSHRTEQLTSAGWASVPQNSFRADAFCGQTRIALDDAIVSREGHVADLRCSGDRAPAPDDRSLLCVEIATSSNDVNVRAIDCDGRELWTRALTNPQPRPADAIPFAFYSELSFVGFAESGPLFQSKLIPGGSPPVCVAFVIDRRQGGWSRLGEMSVTSDALHRCRSPAAWSALLHEPILDTRRGR
jgi:hypothetical protein